MSIHDDPPERIGSTTSGALADPKAMLPSDEEQQIF